MMELQQLVNESVAVITPDRIEEGDGVYIDLSKLDFDKLKAAFAKVPRKNALVYDLQKAIERKLEQMMKENPLRLEFYDRYKEIIEGYNKGKNLADTKIAFDKLMAYLASLTEEDARAFRENLDQESLAIFDLLRIDKELNKKEEVKAIAIKLLDTLKAEKLRIDRWGESGQLKAQVKTFIYDSLQWLPQSVYTDPDVHSKSISVYQHIYSNYPGGNPQAAFGH